METKKQEDAKKEEVIQKLANDSTDLLSMTKDPNASGKLENLQKILAGSSSPPPSSTTTILSTTEGRGFTKLVQEGSFVTNEIDGSKFSLWVKIVTRQLALPAALKDKVAETLGELETISNDMEAHRVDCFFQNEEGGSVSVLRVVVRKLSNGNFKTIRSLMTSSFAMAPDVIIIRKTKEDFSSTSESYDEIMLVQREPSSEDAKELLKISGEVVVPMISNR